MRRLQESNLKLSAMTPDEQWLGNGTLPLFDPALGTVRRPGGGRVQL
jgi:hypothetical protein